MEYEDLNQAESWHLTDSVTPFRYREMIKAARISPRRILDVGVGSGIGGKVLRDHFPEVFLCGLDVVKSRTENLNSIYNQLVYGRATERFFDANSFDLVVAGELIEHIAPVEVENFISEIFRVLQPRGVFVFTTPNPNSVKLRLRRESVLGGSHLSQHFISSTKLRLQLQSFKILRVWGTGKTSRIIGRYFPKCFYGSYLVVAKKY